MLVDIFNIPSMRILPSDVLLYFISVSHPYYIQKYILSIAELVFAYIITACYEPYGNF